MTQEAREQEADPHAGHQMSKAHGNHDRHCGHSVALFRDKFWLMQNNLRFRERWNETAH